MTATKRAIALAGVWLVLAGTSLEALAIGSLVVPAAIALSLRLLPGGVPVRIGAVLGMVPRFVLRSIVGGADVARRAFDPGLPIDPGWIRIPLALPDGGRVALGGELSLMPGTLAAGSVDDQLLVHVLDRNQDAETAIRQEERRIDRTIGSLEKARTPQSSGTF